MSSARLTRIDEATEGQSDGSCLSVGESHHDGHLCIVDAQRLLDLSQVLLPATGEEAECWIFDAVLCNEDITRQACRSFTSDLAEKRARARQCVSRRARRTQRKFVVSFWPMLTRRQNCPDSSTLQSSIVQRCPPTERKARSSNDQRSAVNVIQPDLKRSPYLPVSRSDHLLHLRHRKPTVHRRRLMFRDASVQNRRLERWHLL